MSTALNITYVNPNDNKKGTKAVTNVSASATDAELYNFANDLFGLSTMTFAGVKKVTTVELTAPSGGE